MTQHKENTPRADRPEMPKDYGVPLNDADMLPWSWVEERLTAAEQYWVSTTRPDGRPHVSPIWGVWLDNSFFFEGSPETRRGRNLANNPATNVHIERGADIVIVEGTAKEIPVVDADLAERLLKAFADKYNKPPYNYEPSAKNWEGGGLYSVPATTVLAWSQFPKDCTRWHFDPK